MSLGLYNKKAFLSLVRTAPRSRRPVNHLFVSEAYERLAEVSMEKEDFETALEDFGQALEALGRAGGDHPLLKRQGAIRFSMALCCQFSDRPSEGLAHIAAARAVLQERIRTLQEGTHPDRDVVTGARAAQEIEDVTLTLHELAEKETDLRADFDSAEQRKAVVREALGMMAQAMQGGGPGPAGDGAGPSTGFTRPAETVAAPVQKLGVLGGSSGVKRVSLQPAAAKPAAAPPTGEGGESAGKKRSFADLMGGPAPVPVFSFGGLPKAQKTEAAGPGEGAATVPAFLRPANVAAVYGVSGPLAAQDKQDAAKTTDVPAEKENVN